MSCETTILIDGDATAVVIELETDPALVIDGESGGVMEAGGCG